MTEKKYHRGTFEEFQSWHEAVMEAEGITQEGKIGYINGVPAPERQRTTAYSLAWQYPSEEVDDYVWEFGKYQDNEIPALDYDEAVAAGWFGGE